ncbi:hypothetical protein ACHQM5_005029 [Ranunculus cassubicifolius]
MSDWWKPPSLLGNAVVPNKQEEDRPKQKRKPRRKKKKSKPEDDYEGGDAEGASIAPSLIDSPPPNYQTRKSKFIFAEVAEDATDTGANEPETKSTGSPKIPSDFDLSKMGLEENTVGNDEDVVSEGETSDSDSESEDYHDDEQCMDTIISRGFFELPCTHGLVDTFKDGVKTNVLKQLREMFNKEPSTELVIEVADSIDLLRLMGASDPTLDDVGRKAREGARLYAKGLKVLSEGQDLLRSCLSDISSLK